MQVHTRSCTLPICSSCPHLPVRLLDVCLRCILRHPQHIIKALGFQDLLHYLPLLRRNRGVLLHWLLLLLLLPVAKALTATHATRVLLLAAAAAMLLMRVPRTMMLLAVLLLAVRPVVLLVLLVVLLLPVLLLVLVVAAAAVTVSVGCCRGSSAIACQFTNEHLNLQQHAFRLHNGSTVVNRANCISHGPLSS